MRARLLAAASATALSVGVGMGVTACAPGDPEATLPDSSGPPAELRSALNGIHRAGMPGVHAEVWNGEQVWRGAAGVADLATGSPIDPDMVHRVGSITKTFTAAAVMQQVEQGRIGLDAPIGDYLPRLVPGERGAKITVRMLLNHTSGLAEYLPYAFPSLGGFPSPAGLSPESLETHRFTEFDPVELIRMGVRAPATGEPGSPVGVYSNTNYLLLGRLLEKVTGTPAVEYITEHVIDRAGLRHTAFPDRPEIDGPHPRMYEALFGSIDPPRDYSVYNMSWVMPAAGLISTTADLNRFFGELLGGRIVSPSSLAQMQRTVRVIAMDGQTIDYGLGLHKTEIPGCGIFWGHDGTVFGAAAISMTRADGNRRLSVAMNLARWNELDSAGTPRPHPIDDALAALRRHALCGS
ncbi:serine hydrolase domain-containing protein [Nocardia sp. X0981]